MFKPVSMTRLRLVLLDRDARAVLRHLGQAGVVQLTRTPAGPDTAPLSPRNRSDDMARLERVSARLETLSRSLELPPADAPLKPAEMSLEQAEKNIQPLEEQFGGLLQRRQQLQQRLEEMTAVGGQVADYREVDLPLDPPDESSFLHFVTGSLPANNFATLQTGGAVALLPLAEREGRQILVALTTRQGRPDLDRALRQAGFQPQTLPVVAGATTAAWAERNQAGQKSAAAELEELNAKLQKLWGEFSPLWRQLETAVGAERRLLEAEQNFPRTESSLLVTGWVPSADVPELKQRVQEITRGRCVLETTPAEKLPTEAIPVLLRHPRWLRPFAMLVTAYGLPAYRELEPTVFVAVSYLFMFGMMFGDAGHGLTLVCGGLAIWWCSRQAQLRNVGLLLLFCGTASIISGAIYGSYFGLAGLKKFALWHDPLEGDPLGFMSTAIGVGIVLMSIGLVLNVVNYFRRGHLLGGLLDKFGVAGLLFFWGALALLMNFAALRSMGLVKPAVILFLLVPVLGWTLKEPIEFVRQRRAHPAAAGGLSASFMASLVEVFEGLMSYFSNTISFVRLAAYAMSHSALLLAAFMMAQQVRHLPGAGGVLSVLIIILGNLVAIVLEGIVAAVQTLRLEYYEFFGKFFSGNGQPFEPFCLSAKTETRSV